jgi:hypothetical protein
MPERKYVKSGDDITSNEKCSNLDQAPTTTK